MSDDGEVAREDCAGRVARDEPGPLLSRARHARLWTAAAAGIAVLVSIWRCA